MIPENFVLRNHGQNLECCRPWVSPSPTVALARELPTMAVDPLP